MLKHALSPRRDLTIDPDKVAPLNGARLRYFDRGAGEPILMIHGTSLADSLATPLRLYPPLYDQHRVISYYRAGYNGSTFDGAGVSIADGARHAVELLDHLGIEKAHLMAFSFGGVIGFEAILKYPDRFASAVLLEPYLPRESQKAIDANIAAYMGAMELYQAGDKLGAGLRYMEAVCGPDFLSAVQMTGPLDVWQRGADAMTTTFEVDFPAISTWDFRPSQADAYAPARTKVPVLACMGLQSEAAIPGFRETQDFLMQWLPDVERAGIPFATHGMQSMNPIAVGEAAVDFISRHPITK
jgi:pimeloyl-ACP methyl ester carboxylesterase